MGFLNKLQGMFIPRKAISSNPLYEIALTHLQQDIHKSPHEFIQKIPHASQEKMVQDICQVTETIWQAPDRVLANR